MKNLIKILIALFIIFMSTNLNAQWYKDQILQANGDDIDVSFPNADIGFAVIGHNPIKI